MGDISKGKARLRRWCGGAPRRCHGACDDLRWWKTRNRSNAATTILDIAECIDRLVMHDDREVDITNCAIDRVAEALDQRVLEGASVLRLDRHAGESHV